MHMKPVILGGMLLFAAGTIFAKEIPFRKLPPQVQKAFQQAHPNARKVEVEKEEEEYGEPLYEFEFKENGKKFRAFYHTDGSFFGYERKLPPQLPKPVWESIHKLFPKGSVKEAEVVVNAQNEPLAYEVEIKENGREWKAYFNADGSFINKVED